MRSPRIMHLALAAASLLALFPGAMADNTAHLLVHKVCYPNVQQRAPIAILCAWLTLHRCCQQILGQQLTLRVITVTARGAGGCARRDWIGNCDRFTATTGAAKFLGNEMKRDSVNNP